MAQYSAGVSGLESSRNAIKLRADIHMCFDARQFALVPKPTTEGQGSESTSSFVVHVLDQQEAEFSEEYHNRRVSSLSSVSREFLFARFAWTVLLLVKPFLLAGIARRDARYRVYSDDAGSTSDLYPETRIETLGDKRLLVLYGGGGSRSASPLKRQLSRDDQVDDLDDEPVAFDADLWFERQMEEHEGRGRSRKRQRVRESDHDVDELPGLGHSSPSFGHSSQATVETHVEGPPRSPVTKSEECTTEQSTMRMV